jgi:WD40 repeat protein
MILSLLLCLQAADAFGDPLPEGAVARLGTIRWRHGGYVQSVAFCPDGRHALSAAESVALWDVATGRRVRTFEGTAPLALVDEDHFIAALQGGTLVLWEISTGRRVRDFEGAKGWTGSIAVDRRGHLLMAGGQDATVRLWNIETGACLRTQPRKSPISGVALSPDGRLAAVAPWKEPAELWDVEKAERILSFEDRESRVKSFAFTPDGQRLVAGYNSGSVELREVPSGKIVSATPEQVGRIEGVAISADGKLALAAGSDNLLNLWDLGTGKKVRTLSGHRWSVFSVSFSPDGRRAVSGAGDATVGLWDVETGKRLNVYDTHESEVLAGGFTPDGRRALTASHDQTVAMWDWPTGKRLRTYGPTHGTPWSLAVVPDGKSFFIANGSSALRWDIQSGQSVSYKVDSGGVNSVAISSDGRSFLCGGNSMHLWDAVAGREVRIFRASNAVNPVAFCPDGRHVLAGKDELLKWKIETGEPVGPLEGPRSRIEALAVSPEGRLAATGDIDGTLALWDLQANAAVRVSPLSPRDFRSMAFSPDGSTLATGGYDHEVTLWDVESGKRLMELKGHIGPVYSITFSPSGAELLSTSGDTSALVWRPSLKYREKAREVDLKGALVDFESPDFERWALAREAFLRAGEAAIESLLQAYPPESTEAPSEKAMADLAERLENDLPEVRVKARRELKALGRRALPWIRRGVAAGGSTELRSALEEALTSIEAMPLRWDGRGRIRAVLVLIEKASSPAFREALKKYAAGPVDAYSAESARRALVGE